MASARRTIILKVDPRHPDKTVIALAAHIIRRGGLVGFPTETVYGIAANLLSRRAMSRLCEVKKRHKGKPFTVHIADESMIRNMGCRIDKRLRLILKKFWPGPLTVLLPRTKGGKVGFRMPSNAVARELIKVSRVPIAAPSANISGKNAPRNAAQVLRELNGKLDMIIDAGPAEIGIESTILDMTVDPPGIVRRGAVRASDIRKIWEI